MENKEINNLPKEKFVLVNENKKLHDKELVTKPVGFFMDAMHRFGKNKGSIVGAIVIGVLILYAIIAPIFSPYTVSYHDNYYSYMLPKLFDNENFDFLDGAKNVDTNFVTFVEHYSKGMETGINAIKRQEYTYNEETGKYHYRLDSYRGVGVVFMKSVTREDYYAIQDYQDRTGIQIIYPITEEAKRPHNQKNVNNANFWYETVDDENSSNDIPVNYSFDENGNLKLTNIYQKFTIPVMNSSSNTEKAIRIVLETKGDGYAIKCIAKAGNKYGGKVLQQDLNLGYLATMLDEDQEFVEMVETFDEASVFEYDNVNNYFKVAINNHEDASKNGYFFFGLPGNSGSTADLVPVSEMGKVAVKCPDCNYVFKCPNCDIPLTCTHGDDKIKCFRCGYYDTEKPFPDKCGNPDEKKCKKEKDLIEYKAYFPFTAFEGNTAVTSVTANKEYSFAANRLIENITSYYAGSFFDGNFTVKTSGASTITFEEVNPGEYRILVTLDKAKNYLKAVVDGNNNTISRVAYTASADASLFSFNAADGTIKINLAGHTDPSLDKDYYLGFDTTGGEGTYKLALIPEGGFNDKVHSLKVIDPNATTKDPVAAIDTTKKYRLYTGVSVFEDSIYFTDGNFTGDNYYSKLRVEGEDNLLYDYAIQRDGEQFEIRVCYYEYYHYYHKEVLHDRIDRPFFLFGTTNTGQDIFTCLASGARFSFILAISVASVNLIVGAIYGAIEGYYGGKTDMIMERIVEILSAVPFMIVITLLKYHMEKTPQVLILFIAFFLTGWIGMSGTVRMQFYRFKNQEYVLAARTLGAKDPRIMFKHIFPNALGTIVTSCVLVIPGMIFSETSLSYLGIINLNSGNMTSVGTLLAGAQPYIDTFPHMILFPAIFISLLMLCFNLFGNGLRDAFNPSLRGTED